MHPQTNTKNRLPQRTNHVVELPIAKIGHSCGSFANTREDHFVGGRQDFCNVRYYGLDADASERVRNGRRIARVVFHDRDFHKTPFVLGSESPSRRTAILMAFANALKMASILWCSIVPSALIFRLHRALSENDLKK